MPYPRMTLPDLILAGVYRQGLSITDCARVLDTTPGTIRRRLVELGVEIRSKNTSTRRHWRKRLKLIQELRAAADAAGLPTDLNRRSKRL